MGGGNCFWINFPMKILKSQLKEIKNHPRVMDIKRVHTFQNKNKHFIIHIYHSPAWLTEFNSATLYIIDGSNETFSINMGEVVIFWIWASRNTSSVWRYEKNIHQSVMLFKILTSTKISDLFEEKILTTNVISSCLQVKVIKINARKEIFILT